MCHIRERTGKGGQKRYQFIIRNKKYGQLSRTFSRKTEGHIWAQETAVAIRNGNLLSPTTEQVNITAGEMIDRYILDTFAERRSPKTPQQTLMWWKQRVGNILLTELRKADIHLHWNRLANSTSARTRKFLSPRSLNSYLETFSACLSYAVHLDLLKINPCLGIRRKKMDNQRRLDPLSKDQVLGLLSAAERTKNEYLATAILLTLNTGGRRAEVLGLRWNEINLHTGEIEFCRTKNGKRRRAFLGSAALERLKEHERKFRTDSPLVFPSRKKRWISNSTSSTEWEDMTRPFKKACKMVGLKLRWHDLRHVAASYLAASGANMAETMMALGHSSPSTTARYLHLFSKKQRELAEIISLDFLTPSLTPPR